MAPHEVVDWQLECGQIRQRGAHLLSSGLWADCSFLLGSDKVPVKAHKMILAMASPVFQAMFYGPIAEEKSPIAIPDIQPDVFMKVLQYMYTDDIDLDNYIIGFELYYAAQKYMLPHLQTVCTAYLSGNLVPQNACRIYEFAELIGDKELRAESLKMLKAQTKLALADSSFEELALDTVVKIFSMGDISIDSELVLLEAAERYYLASQKKSEQNFINALLSDDHPENGSEANNKHYKNSDEACNAEPYDISGNNSDENNQNKTNITADEDQSRINKSLNFKEAEIQNVNLDPVAENCNGLKIIDSANANINITENEKESTCFSSIKSKPVFVFKGKQDSVHKLIKPIRFLTLTVKELAEYKPNSPLLPPLSILALMMNIASTETYMSLPDGFSTCREHRCYNLFGKNSLFVNRTVFGNGTQ